MKTNLLKMLVGGDLNDYRKGNKRSSKSGFGRRFATSKVAKHIKTIWTKIVRFMCSNSLEAYGFSKRDIKRVLEETR